ncbi:MAG: sugar phosphate isomerase/epimerase [Phycisphaerae bacterium]|nr:sugar phosphate isomerase/epimerase [Phycisphaerae bacterium]
MHIGFITDLSEEDFRFAGQTGVSVLEYNENADSVEPFLARTDEIKDRCRRYRIKLDVVGRFGRNYISDDEGTAMREIAATERLMDAAAELGASVFVTGAGHAEQREHTENCRRAVDVLGRFVEAGASRGLRVALYNCHWGNFAFAPPSWNQILSELPELGIKYDPSHAYYDDRDWLSEMREWGGRFYHTHAKGSLKVAGKQFEDPNPGFDEFNWGAFFHMLYHHDYQGDVMIEPHAATWLGRRRHTGLRFSLAYLRQFVL